MSFKQWIKSINECRIAFFWMILLYLQFRFGFNTYNLFDSGKKISTSIFKKLGITNKEFCFPTPLLYPWGNFVFTTNQLIQNSQYNIILIFEILIYLPLYWFNAKGEYTGFSQQEITTYC